MSTKKRNPVVDGIQYFFFRIGAGIIRMLPLPAAYALARFTGRMFYFLDLKHRKRTVTHILHSGLLTDRAEAKKLAKANMTHLVKVFVEIVKFDQIVNLDNLHEYITVADDPVSRKMMSRETAVPVILATGHLGNWELAGGTHTVLTGIPMTSIMRPLGNRKIGEYFYKRRASFRHTTVSKEKGLRPLLRAWKAGETITIVADQHASKKEGVDVVFFGHPARAHATPALLHLKTGLPIALVYLLRADDHFHFEFHSSEPFTFTPTGNKAADVQAICQRYTSNLEDAIRKHPEQWLWAHRRWLDCGRGHDAEYANWKKETPDATPPESAV